ncbi:4-(cytidine 5'-diphospho)-2-C-methyl-D-erythritol kinase [Halovulum sp. GXIMD14793]
MAECVELARAKLNLTLHVTGRRNDGYHLLDSLVVFPDMGDEIRLRVAPETRLTIDGPYAHAVSSRENLIFDMAARLGVTADIHLTKNLPVAAGIGGGSADAAATARGLCQLYGKPLPDPSGLADLGADIPVCLSQKPSRMQGIGENLTSVNFPDCACVLVNPGVAVPTGPVFTALENVENPPMPALSSLKDFDRAVVYLSTCRNDLQSAAINLAPPIKDVLTILAKQKDCALARMSGSGATCFGLFRNLTAAQRAARTLRDAHPDWWVQAASV